MLNADATVFLFDVDNTLLDNDRFGADLTAHLQHAFGKDACERYWSIYATRRDQTGYADYLGTLQAFRDDVADHPAMLGMSSFLLDYPFGERLYPRALEVIETARRIGRAVIVSDGDIVFQPRKIERSGLWHAFGGAVVVSVHKEESLLAIERRYPARHYVMIDDKPGLLAVMKRKLGERISTVFVRQGHYARAAIDAAANAPAVSDPPPDLAIDAIGDLGDQSIQSLLAAANERERSQVHQECP